MSPPQEADVPNCGSVCVKHTMDHVYGQITQKDVSIKDIGFFDEAIPYILADKVNKYAANHHLPIGASAPRYKTNLTLQELIEKEGLPLQVAIDLGKASGKLHKDEAEDHDVVIHFFDPESQRLIFYNPWGEYLPPIRLKKFEEMWSKQYLIIRPTINSIIRAKYNDSSTFSYI